jgi:hypothetical protein
MELNTLMSTPGTSRARSKWWAEVSMAVDQTFRHVSEKPMLAAGQILEIFHKWTLAM